MAVFQEFGDAEVQEADLALGIDQDVGRFQIAMDDEFAVGMCHRVGDLQEQPEPGAHVEIPFPAVHVDAHALHVFDRQVRLPVTGDARVVQVRDIRMGKRGQDLAFTCHPFGESRAFPGAVR